MFYASRYDKGDPDFINIPLDKEQYETFVADLLSADVVLPHEFEESKYFESCLPIEVIASRGLNTLAFGPMKPVGLTDPKTQKRAHAVIQLSAENKFKTAYNLVGFQTKMKYSEQTRVFKKLPGLENAEFVRLGSLHRNTFINSPKVLNPTLNLRKHENVFLAGQITGTEGYVESIATGLVAGINIYNQLKERPLFKLPETTILGALLSHITNEQLVNVQPPNVNFGLFPPLDVERKILKDKKIRNELFSKRSQAAISDYLPTNLHHPLN
jgi:methylenetetrahydrofolate--tRNA-(uracil-5-)-methyltransferase